MYVHMYIMCVRMYRLHMSVCACARVSPINVNLNQFVKGFQLKKKKRKEKRKEKKKEKNPAKTRLKIRFPARITVLSSSSGTSLRLCVFCDSPKQKQTLLGQTLFTKNALWFPSLFTLAVFLDVSYFSFSCSS